MKKLISLFFLILLVAGGGYLFIQKQNQGTSSLEIQSSKSERNSVNQRVQRTADLSGERSKERVITQKASPRFAVNHLPDRIAKLVTVEEEKQDRVILTPEEVLRRAGEPSGREGEDLTIRETLEKEDWDGQAYLLVQALEQKKGLVLSHEQVMDFLGGEQAGWDSNYYRWIADELMTTLREDRAESTFEDLNSLASNPSLDSGIRDYAVQHLGHLIDQGVNVPQGIETIWDYARNGNEDIQSTALLGLYQYAQAHPDQQPVDAVIELAVSLVDSADSKTQATANGIIQSLQ